MSEHPHDCPPECRLCRDLDDWQELCDALDCDQPVMGIAGEFTECDECARCNAALAALRDLRSDG